MPKRLPLRGGQKIFDTKLDLHRTQDDGKDAKDEE